MRSSSSPRRRGWVFWYYAREPVLCAVRAVVAATSAVLVVSVLREGSVEDWGRVLFLPISVVFFVYHVPAMCRILSLKLRLERRSEERRSRASSRAVLDRFVRYVRQSTGTEAEKRRKALSLLR